MKSACSFPIHLCQPDPQKSCAACCGIYNFKDNTRQAVSRRLQRNSSFIKHEMPELSPKALHFHSRNWRSRNNGSVKRFETIFNCEFVGFLDAASRRVGCLLHPLLHNGKDLRQCSFYGAELCDGHFCPSYRYLTLEEQAFVVKTTQDWYLYGLVITDIDLVKGIYQALSDRLGQAVQPSWLASRPVQAAIGKLWRWKLHWPYRRDGFDWFGKYLFIGDHYEEIHIPYELWGVKPSSYHRIFLALGSEFRSVEQLRHAELLIEDDLNQAAKALEEALSQKTLDRPFLG
ncbi:MAG: hypothetical protein WHS46_01015 [Desulfosoma sp.]